MARSDRSGGIDGVLVLAKPSGPTSHDMVNLVRRLTGTRRVGHGGTLDPFASGVLPVFLGLGTRIVEYHMGDAKAYKATICFGARSTTDDRDGELVPSGVAAPTRTQVAAALPAFRGEIEQRPPAFSALKVGGRRAYELAREGAAPELATRQVTIHRLDLVAWDGSDPERPMATVEVECSAGTYIRAIARDLGETLGCGAYLGALVRTASGPFRLKAAHDLDELRAAAAEGSGRVRRLVLPIDAGLEAIPTAGLNDSEVDAIARGQQVRPARRLHLEQGQTLRLLDARGALIGMGEWRGGRIVPDKVFVPAPTTPLRPRDGHGGAGESAGGATEDPATGGDGVHEHESGHERAVPDRAGHSGRGDRDGESGEALLGTGGQAGHGDTAIVSDVEPPLEAVLPRLRDVRLRRRLPETCIEVVDGIDALRASMGRLYLAVGVFDGLHRGHLYLLRQLRRAAARRDARASVVTFDAHPEEIVRGIAPPLLCDPGERLVRLAAAGVQVTVVQHFDAALRATTYDRFVEMIRERVDVGGFLMTPDAAFGYERRGTPEAVTALGEERGFEVTVVQPLLLDGAQVRSSEIRSDVAAGRLKAARRKLGRPLSVTGFPVPRDDGWYGLEFTLPVALPPTGEYRVLVGPAWTPRGGDADGVVEQATEPSTARIGGGRIRIDRLPANSSLGVRVVFG